MIWTRNPLLANIRLRYLLGVGHFDGHSGRIVVIAGWSEVKFFDLDCELPFDRIIILNLRINPGLN